jgi:HK97 family phage prohead protease
MPPDDQRMFDEQDHPRNPAGGALGGQFADKAATAAQGKKKAQPPAKKAPAKKAPAHHDTGTLAYDPDSNTGPGYGSPDGDKRVHQLQQALNRLGLHDGAGKALKDDGKLGPKTTAAVKKAQRRLGLTPDGKVTPELLAKLVALKALPHRSALGDIFLRAGAELRAEMSTSSINDLPDSAFAYIEPGGHKDEHGRTVPRSKRHFPIHDAAHVRNALARIAQGAEFGDLALPKVKAAAKKFGIQVNDDGRSYGYEMKEGATMAAVERRFTLIPVELRMVGDKPRIGGYAAMFGRVSQNLGGFVEVVERSFFNKSRGDGWPDVMARYNHDDNMLLGTSGAGTLALQLDETGLDYLVDPPASRADVIELVQRGDVRKSSFAFRLPKDGDEWTMSDQGYPLRRLITGALVDVAPVNAPAYLDTSAGLRSLAERMEADEAEVRSAAEANELHRFFKVTSGAPMPKPKPRTLGAAAMVALMNRKEDPWG